MAVPPAWLADHPGGGADLLEVDVPLELHLLEDYCEDPAELDGHQSQMCSNLMSLAMLEMLERMMLLAMFNCKKEEGSNYRGGGDRFQEPESLDA